MDEKENRVGVPKFPAASCRLVVLLPIAAAGRKRGTGKKTGFGRWSTKVPRRQLQATRATSDSRRRQEERDGKENRVREVEYQSSPPPAAGSSCYFR
jgi:hypothetical protein